MSRRLTNSDALDDGRRCVVGLIATRQVAPGHDDYSRIVQPIEIPLTLQRNVVGVWAADGEAWLATVPALVHELADAWRTQVHGPAGRMSFRFVVKATRDDGSPTVLKIGPTGPAHLNVEAAALGAYTGHGAVRLLAHDLERGALLLLGRRCPTACSEGHERLLQALPAGWLWCWFGLVGSTSALVLR